MPSSCHAHAAADRGRWHGLWPGRMGSNCHRHPCAGGQSEEVQSGSAMGLAIRNGGLPMITYAVEERPIVRT